MASDSPPSPNPYNRGFLTGCLVGCSPLILLFCLIILAFIGSLSSPGSPTQETSALPLPGIDPTSPVAGLLPTPPQTNNTPVYLGDDLSCVPELLLEAAPRLTTDAWKRRKARATAVALHLNRKE